MTALDPDDWVKAKRADEGECQLAIHALHGIIGALDWIDSVEIGVTEENKRGVRASLLVAGKLITDDVRSRF